jgi:SAM-dependent methyltransferase
METYLRHVNKNSLVMEIGASNKDNTEELAKHVFKVIGIEYFPHRVPQNFSNIEYVCGDWQELSKTIPLNSIDCAVSSHTIEHIQKDLKAINELYKVLKPGGVAILNTPNRQRLTRRLIEIFTGPRKFPYWEHVREYSYTDLYTLLMKSKFKNFEITPVLFGIQADLHWKFYNTNVHPKLFNLANYWEILLTK